MKRREFLRGSTMIPGHGNVMASPAGVWRTDGHQPQSQWRAPLGACRARYATTLRPAQQLPCATLSHAEHCDERAALHVWMAPAWQEKM